MKDQMEANFSLKESLIPSCPDINRLITEPYTEDTANARAKMNKEVPPEHVMRSSGNNERKTKINTEY